MLLAAFAFALGAVAPVHAYANPIEGVGNAAMRFFGVSEEVEPAAAFDGAAVADPNTTTTWQTIVDKSTENIGRIWTDKTVSAGDIELPAIDGSSTGEIDIAKGDSDFLVGFSALSSTSNTSVTSSKPLDIVLVLDVSGSMDDPLNYVYTATYNVRENGRTTYYAQNDDGSYTEIDRISGWFGTFDHWELNGVTVEPKKNASDATTGRIQFYTRSENPDGQSKMAALKTAANNFIETTAKNNDSLAADKRHQISIVKFAGTSTNTVGNDTYNRGQYNYSQIVTTLNAYTSENMTTATDTVNSINAGGATQADYGMQHAQTALKSARQDAQKVVIFFTDGQPTDGSQWNNSVANGAITAAKTLKDSKALVYTIGVFADADPSNTDTSTTNRFNAYMHGVSSNFPGAIAWDNLGDRAKDSNYYKAATDADELNKIFQEISEEINSGTGLPTEVTDDGFANKDGYITFTDELGAYMQVDGFKELVFADKIFNPVGEPTTEGNVTTYKYEGTGGNALYPDGNVSDIVVQVTKGDSLERGDIVTVKIPGSLIPLRTFKVDSTDAGTTMTVGEAYPLRIFFGVSVKPEVAEAIGSGTADQALLNYIAQNTTDDGKTSFYSNLYTGTNVVNGKRLGDTTASFVPAEGNSFYYFTENTPLYTDEACQSKLMTEPQSGEEYYYKRSYYELNEDGKTATQKDSITRFVGANFEATTTFWGQSTEDGSYYIKAGAPRLTRIDDLTLAKKENTTGTSTEVINPNWDNINNPEVLNVSLGNNGKIDVELPGTLAIYKDAQVAADKNLGIDVLKDKSFEFEITVASATNKSFSAVVKNGQGDTQGDSFELAFDAQGKAKHSIKDDETLYIYGLDANAEYTVIEVADKLPAGFTQTSKTNDKGAIASNKVTTASFENTYDVVPVTVEADAFAKWRKDFTRWDLAESFDIRLSGDQTACPMPEGSETGDDGRGYKVVQATEQSKTGNFGSIEFTKPGTYTYTITEVAPAQGVAGVSYSDADYDITVTVTDDGKGKLSATSVMTKTNDDGGQALTPPESITDNTATFVNSFNAGSTTAGPGAIKAYTNYGGSNAALADNMFTFKAKAVGENAESAPMPDWAKPGADGYFTVTNIGQNIAFGQATFNADHVGKTYTYEISEVIPAEATAENNYTFNGMTYDPTVYHAKFKVTAEGEGDVATTKVAVSYYKMVDGQEQPLGQGETIPVFTNSYDPADAVLEGDTAIKVKKTLNGRDSLENEKFDFTMGPANTATRSALVSKDIVFEGSEDNLELSTSITELKKGVATTASMGKVTFKKPGTYVFNVIENAPADGKGMVYDKHAARVTVVVTDNNGELEATVAYNNGQDADTDAAAFVNTYTASNTYGAGMHINVGKTLNGRAQKAGEFEFKVEGVDESGSVPAQEAEAKLADTDKSFKTIAGAPDGVQSLIFDKLGNIKFTQADAGKTFTYKLSEVVPEEPLGGVTYDAGVWYIYIGVVDNGDGTMHALTDVAKVTNEGAGESVRFDSSDGADTAILDFTNTYKAASVEVDPAAAKIQLTKTFEGREWKDTDTFKFVLVGDEKNPKPARVEETVNKPAEGNKATFDFGKATFDTIGSYHYQVSEVIPEDGSAIPGVTYDEHVADIYVNVEDPGDGQLVATASVYNTTFTNKYEAKLNHNDAGGLVVTKTTFGHAMTQGQFKFQIEALEGEGVTAEETAQRIGIKEGTTGDFGNVAGDAGQKVNMPSPTPIEFTQADAGKVFKFQVSEQGADGNFGTGGIKDGYTYDGQVYTVEISVADNGDGTLTLTTKVTDKTGNVTEQTSSATDKHETRLDFVNSYAASTTDDTDVNLTATKTLNGRDMTADEFSFKVVSNPLDDAGAAVDVLTGGKNAAADNGKAAKIDFGSDNQLDYELKDLKELAADTTANKYVEVDTTDDGKPQYTLHYTALEETGSLPDGVTALENATSFDFTVTVVDNDDGTLTATPHYPDGGLAFVNNYQWDPATIDPDASAAGTVTKVLKGNREEPLQAGEFEFTMITEAIDGSLDTVADADGNVWPAKKTAKNAADGSVDFGAMSFSKPGNYKVTIVEKADAAAHMTYDGHAFTYTIKVTYDNTTGTLTAAVEGAQGSPTFTNVYFDETDAKDVLADPKDPTTSVNGKLVGVGDELTYTIDWVNNAVDENGVPVKAEITVTDKVPDGTTFVKASDGGEQKDGVVTWSLGEQDPGASGTVTLTVKVANDAVSTVENQASIEIGKNDPVATNKVVVNVPQKTVTKPEGSDTLKVGDMLTYTISYKNTDAAAATVTITDKLPAGLTFVSADNGGVEQDGTITWITNDVQAGADGTVTFTAEVNESAVDGIGNTATVKVGENGPVVNTNTTPDEKLQSGDASIAKTVKVPEGALINTEQEFTFTVELLDTADKPLGSSYSYKVADADGQEVATGTVANGEGNNAIALKHLQKATITGLPEGAKVRATETEVTGYTADEITKTSAAVEADATAAIEFVNTYSFGEGATITGENSIRAQKDLQGRAWAEGDSFTAQLEAVGGKAEAGNDIAKADVPMPAGVKEGVSTVEMTSAEPVSFGDITYKMPGTYTYKVTEVKGNLGGMTYSTAEYEVTVAVADEKGGTLSAEVSYKLVGAEEGSEAPTIAEFVNTYEAALPEGAPVTTDNLFTKILEGRDWKESDSFTFTITPDSKSTPVPEKSEVTLTGLTNKEDEEVKFGFGTIDFTFDHIKDVEPAADGSRTKDFTYTVKETIPADADKIPGITYDEREVKLTVTLIDDGKGKLSATYKVEGGSFTNTYLSGEVDVDTAGGVQIVKTMTGRAIAEGDFEFTMTPTSPDAAAKFGEAKVVKTAGAELGTGADANTAVETMKIETGLVFGLEDAGKTFAFDVAETKGGGEGYTNDTKPRTLEFVVEDNTQGTITVTAKLDGEVAATWGDTVATRAANVVSIPFSNSYDAGSITVGGEGGVPLAGTKKLTGRPMVAGEFHFNVVNAADDSNTAVATGTNDANGNINFPGITYTTEQLNKDVAAGLATVDRSGDADVYTYTYTVSEDAAKNDAGVTVIQGSQTIKVKVTDDRAGKLTAEVAYPESGMVFKNAYGAGVEAKTAINGTKVLKVESGNHAPNIEGKYTFTLTGSEGAPMPANTTATNAAAGNVSFGEIVYTMENVFGDSGAVTEVEGSNEAATVEDGAAAIADNDAAGDVTTEGDATADGATVDGDTAGTEASAGTQVVAASEGEPMPTSDKRSKTFTYTVTESGSVPGVINDPVATKTITVTVTDNGDGTLSAVKTAESATTDFTFTNTYKVTPQESSLTGEGNFTITKKLTGRDMNADEFEFMLTPEGGEALNASNDANGNVEFPAIIFNQPGTYKYELAEVEGKLGGVTYDKTAYNVVATVTDNGDGTLKIEWSVAKDDKEIEGEDIAFANEYQAKDTSLVFNAAKVLTGRDFEEGEFTFELLDGEGKILQAVKNDALTGEYAPVTFDAIAYDEPGEFDYQIREVKGDAEGITYDETVFTYHVVVTDNLEGELKVEATEGETGAPVFRNTYTEPAKPEDSVVPSDPEGSVDPGKPAMPAFAKTNDATGTMLAGAAVLAVGAVAVVAFCIHRMRRG